MAKKIATTGKIKEVKMGEKGTSIKLGDLKFTTGQGERLGDWAADGEELKITIEPKQEKLPGIE